jgi:hypothetical protein
VNAPTHSVMPGEARTGFEPVKQCVRALRAAGIELARHTFASWAIAGGVQL